VEKRDLSVVIPVFNSSNTLESVVNELQDFLSTSGFKFETILVNDCSSDSSSKIISILTKRYKNCKGVNLLIRQGQHRAVLAGLNQTTGEYVVVMDDDGQNPPAEIIKLFTAAKEGYDVVFGNYIEYKQSIYRKLASSLMKLFVRYIFSSPSEVSVSNFKIMHQRVVRLICRFARSSPYINGEALIYAIKPKSIRVNHRNSLVGKSRYSTLNLFSLFKNVLFTYSLRPLRLITSITFLVSVSGLLTSFSLLVFQYTNDARIQGWTSIVLTVTFLSTLTILSIGLISEYLIRALESNSKRSVLDFVEEE
jgi:undecaprenyl-phosphate 4-deoxy-4-formamido-L-arabinose transferase